MLGCQDFCGYYDWTFRHVAKEHGAEAVERLWAEAIAGESQGHYLDAALREGLRGLYRTWVKTGEEESCDWTFTLDEERNVLRWDMRRCPSKGHLLQRDLNAHSDYCDHCMGWIVPLLDRAGIEVAAHEHNHCGQCWAEMSVRGRPYQPARVEHDIRDDARWRHGYIDRWESGVRSTDSSIEQLENALAKFSRFAIISSAAQRSATPVAEDVAVMVSGEIYPGVQGDVHAVMIDAPPAALSRIAERYLATEPQARPVLVYSYFPSVAPVDFASAGLPRPWPVLPLLIERGVYTHRPHHETSSSGELMSLMAAALGKTSFPR